MSTWIRTAQTAVSALLVLSAGAAAAQTPPLPSLDGVNSISSGTLRNAASGGNGVVRTSGGSAGLPVIVTVDGTTANIQTAANRSVIDWQSFNIGEGHRVNFLLPDRASVAVNRIRGVGADFASRIDGDLWSNGNVWLLNPNGVFFGASARVDVAGLLATPAGLRNLDDLIGVDGTYDTTSTVRFNMPGSSFPTEVTTPGPVSVAAGAEILVRGGPAMFIVGSGVQGRTLTVGGTVTSRSSNLVRGVLTPPGVFDSNGDYGSLPTDSDPAEEISSQVVYAASGDFVLTMIERAIDEPSPPNPLSSNDLDLFEFTVERGFAGFQSEKDQMASEAILIEHTAKTVAGQVVVRAAAEASALLRRYDPRDDLGDNLGCDPRLDSCTINRNPDHDTYLYDLQTDRHQFVCAAGPADEACGTINGTETPNGFTYLAYLGVETTQSPNYICSECTPGIRIRSSLLALDPRTRSRDYGASLSRSLDIDASPSFGFLDNLVITRDANGRPVETVVSADPRAVSVVLDPRDAPNREFDFGADGGGLQQVALELVSAGELSLRGRDVCATFTGLCFQQGVIYRSSDPYTAPRVNLRLQSAFGSSITADRLLRLEETFLAGAVLQLAGGNQPSGGGNSGSPAPLRQLVLRNARIDPRAGFILSGGDLDPARIVVGTAADATNDVTLGQIFGGEGLDVDIDVGGMLRIIDTFVTSPGDPLPGYVSAGNISLKGRGISVGELEIKDYTVEDDGIHALTLLSRATDPAKFSFGRISAFAPKSKVSITSAAKLEFDPLDKFNTSALPDNLRLVSTGGALCVGVTDSVGCSVADLELLGSIELRGQLGIEVGAVTAGGEALLRAAAGSVAARDVEGARVDIQAGTKSAPPPGSDPWTEGEGVFTARIGDITARDGTVLLLGRDGIEAGDVSQARIVASKPQVDELELRSKSGSIVAGTLESPGADPAVGGKLKVETAQGALISLAAVTAGDVDVRADAGKVRIGVADDGFAAGAVTARSGRISLEGREGVEAGALTATTQVLVGASRGSVALGDISAGGSVSAAGPCDGKAVCLGAGFDGVDGSGRKLTTGTVSASVGEVLMDGRDGVTTGGAVTAGAGRVEIRSASGIVDTRAGTVTAGNASGAHDAVLVGKGLALGDVTAQRDVNLTATGVDGGLATGVLTAGRALKVTGVARVGIGAAQIGGTPQSVQLSSTEGGVCLGALVNGTCTGQALTKDTDLTLQGKTGVQSGALAVRSALVDSSQGALALGDVTVTDGKLALYGRTGVTAGKLTQSRSETPPTAPNIDLLSAAGAITVGDITGTGLLYGRSSGLMSIGTVGGFKDIDLRAGGTLTAGAIAASGFVQLQSVDGSLDLQDITAGAAKDAPDTDPCKGTAICLRAGEGAGTGTQTLTAGQLTASTGALFVRGRSGVTAGDVRAEGGVLDIGAAAGGVTLGAVRGSGAVTVTARDALSAGDVVGATSVVGDVVMSSADGALTVKSVTAGTSTVLSSVDLRSKGDLGVPAGGTTRGNIVASGGARLESGAALRVGDVTATQDVRVTAQDALSAGAVRSTDRGVRLESLAGTVTATRVAGRGAVDLLAIRGRVSVGSDSGSSFTGGAVSSSDAAVTLTARDGVATGDLNATDVTVTATGGDISLGGATARTLTVNAAAGQAGAGDVRLGGAVTLAPAVGTPAGATPALRVQAERDITVVGAVTSERNVAFSAGRNFANSSAIRVTAGTAADGSGAAGYGGIDIRAVDAEIGAPLQARGAGVNLLATGGGIALGDDITAPSGAMRISDAELQSIDASTAALRSAVSSTAGRDILVGDITLDRARIGELLLATRQGGKVRVTGTVRGTGAPAMRIGETGMRPDTIEVSGALGTLAAPIGVLQLRSAGHILFGPQTFIDAANAAQDILAFGVAAASQGATPGRLFLVSAATSFDTPRAILQQNTGPSLRDGDGIRIGAPAGNITATFATDTPPQRIELFGRVVDAQGNVTSAQQASLVAGLLPGGTASNAVWRLNTCVIGSGAGCAGGDLLPPPSMLLQSPLPLPPVSVPGNGGDDGDPGTAGGGGSTDDDDDADGPRPVRQLADAGPSAEEQRISPLEVDPGSRDLLRPADDGAVREPGVGSANEDLWPQGALPQ